MRKLPHLHRNCARASIQSRLTSKPRHDIRVQTRAFLALLDPLLGSAAEIVEGDEPLGRTGESGDNEADPRIQLTRMPLDLGDDPAGRRPALRPIAEPGVGAANVLGWTSHRAAQERADPLLQNAVGRQPDGVLEPFGIEKRVELRHGEGGIGAEVSPQPPLAIGDQPGIRGDVAAVELQLEPAIEPELNRVLSRFTRWMRHAGTTELAIRY